MTTPELDHFLAQTHIISTLLQSQLQVQDLECLQIYGLAPTTLFEGAKVG